MFSLCICLRAVNIILALLNIILNSIVKEIDHYLADTKPWSKTRKEASVYQIFDRAYREACGSLRESGLPEEIILTKLEAEEDVDLQSESGVPGKNGGEV